MRAKRVTIEDLRKLCPKYGRHTNCKYWMAYKFIPEHYEMTGSRGGKYKGVDWTRGKWVLKKGIKEECILEDFCFDESIRR